MSDHLGVTVWTVLHLPALQRGAPQILAGDDPALDRPVRWVHAGEVPNIASLLKGRELLLTTGMGMDRSPDGLRQFIDDLSNSDVAGLAIELGRVFDSLPQELIEQARLRNMPLIALHRELPFVEVTEAAHQEIMSHQVRLMEQGNEFHRRFTELMLNGAGVAQILEALSEAIGNPVVLENARTGGISHVSYCSSDTIVLAAWESFRRGSHVEFETIRRTIPGSTGEVWGTLTAIGLDSPLAELDAVATDRAVGLLALGLRQQQAETVLALRERGDFLQRVITRDIDDAEASIRLAAMGFPRRMGPVLPIAIAHASSANPLAGEEAAWALVWRDVRKTVGRRGRPMVVGARGDGGLTVALVAIDETSSRTEEADFIAETVERFAKQRFGASGLAVIAVGRIARTWSQVRHSLAETEDTALAAAHGPKRPWHDAARADVDRLLWAMRDHSALRSFVRTSLDPLIEHDQAHGTQLIATLRAICDNPGQKSETARQLHVERQTLYYRLARIESLLGVDLSDGGQISALHLALRARDYVRNEVVEASAS
ncbi:PucR family transcriptional regulator [Mycobacterium sp. 21AC1]|uniref:PucR family transcriptional regulator n=1 Tax=[Mycobacterium] appelbergii TaxID=2939269 RepID=UPI002938CF7F|nr:PucR family transcriptional regulator [Mycobacterium sp. 21AC1]MDV3124455.1 PucR family transcriptional regulator [Mycobacterium sp. 21AC1]